MKLQPLLLGIAGVGALVAGVLVSFRAEREIGETDLRDLTSVQRQIDLTIDNGFKVPSYLKALRERIAIRAYPFQSVDPTAYARGLEHIQSMPKAILSSQIRPELGQDPLKKDAGGTDFGGDQDTLPRYWEFIGPRGLGVPYTTYYGPTASKLNGRIGGLCFDPKNSNVIYMGAPAGGIWKTIDRGVNWKPVGNYLGAPYVGHIAVSPKDSNIVIAGLGDRDGGTGLGNAIMRSQDGGITWTSRTIQSGTSNTAVVFDPEDPEIVMASYYSGGGLYRSVNGGLSYNTVTAGIAANAQIQDLTYDSPDASGLRRYYLHVRSVGLFVSLDKGQTWTLVPEPATAATRIQIAGSKVTPGRIYYSNQSTQKVFRGDFTVGAGFAWTDITAGIPNGYNWSQAGYDQHLTVAKHMRNGTPTDFVYAGLITIAAYDGAGWTDIGVTYSAGAKTHNDQHCMAVFPGDENITVFGNDGGLYPLTYNPVAAGTGTWSINITANTNLGITMFYTGEWHPTNATRMLGGTQDNASPVSTGNLNSWVNRTGGDGCGVAINPVNPLIQYGSAQGNVLYRTSNGWSTQGNFSPPTGWGGDTIPFVTRMGIDPNSPNALYIATNYLWRFNAIDGTWDTRLGATILAPSGGTVLSIAVAPSDSNVIYSGSSTGNLFRSGDAGATWRRLDSITGVGLSGRSLAWIDVSPTNPNDILVVSGGSGAKPVVRISDTTSAVPVAVDVSGGGGTALPQVHSTSITRDDLNPATHWFMSNDLGIFMTTNGGATWSNATEPLGLPICEISRVKWVPGTGFLNAASYGRGMWRIRIRDSRASDTTDLKVEVTGTQLRGYYFGVYKFTNVGSVQANDLRITSATLTVPGITTTRITPLPLRVGMVDAGASQSAELMFSGAAKRDVNGKLVISGTYVVGTTTVPFTRSDLIRFP